MNQRNRQADDRPSSRRNGNRSVLVVSLLFVGLIASILLPAIHANRDDWRHGNAGRCWSNLTQIGQAILLYANENHDAMPADFATLLATEDLVPEVFVCGSTDDEKTAATQPAAIRADFAAGGHCSYVYVDGYATHSTIPADAVVAFEPFGHHDDRTNVLFGDGHVERVDRATAASIQKQFDAGVRPIRAADAPAGQRGR